MRIVVMGPSGSGKSTVGLALAERIGARFVDADDLHPAANVEKMLAGIPLDDDDRMPWLRVVGQTLQAEDDIVIACSALKRAYRDLIRSEAPQAFFGELSIARDTLEKRMLSRGEHYMPTSLLDTQLQAFEPLQGDEQGICVDESADVDTAAALIAAAAAR